MSPLGNRPECGVCTHYMTLAAEMGACLRYPPQTMPTMKPPRVIGGEPEMMMMSVHPQITPGHPGCGEHNAKSTLDILVPVSDGVHSDMPDVAKMAISAKNRHLTN